MTAKLPDVALRMSFVPPVPGMNSYAKRLPPPLVLIVAPDSISTDAAEREMAFGGGPAVVISAP
jgi:hypothetical protein